MDYSQLSDVGINRRVAAAVGIAPESVYQVNSKNAYDPCNNPADAWPIIESNGITIINDKNCFPRATNDSYAFINEQYDECLHALAGNPLRAAMIVFLMMQDAKHA